MGTDNALSLGVSMVVEWRGGGGSRAVERDFLYNKPRSREPRSRNKLPQWEHCTAGSAPVHKDVELGG